MGWQRIYKAHEDLKNVYKHATSRAPTQSLPWWTRTRENVLKNTWVCTKATVWSPGPLRITLFAHIRFLKSLRSTTASPILSHFHTLLHHTHTHTLTAPGANFCQTLNFQQMLQSQSSPQNIHITLFPVTCEIQPFNSFGDPSLYNHTVALWSAQGRTRRTEGSASRTLNINASFMEESVLLSVCITTQGSILAPEIG